MYLSASTSTSLNCGLSSNLRVGRVRDHLTEPEVADTALAGDLERSFRPFGLVVLIASQGRAEHVAVVAAGQPAIAREHQKERLLDGVVFFEQRVGRFLTGLAQVGDQLGDLAGERLGLGRAVRAPCGTDWSR